MKIRITIIICFFNLLIKAQDYVVEERFTPKNYGTVMSDLNPNNRFIFSWGRTFDFESKDLIKSKGSGYFDLRYQYNQHLFWGCHFVSGFGYNWQFFKLENDSAVLFSDSVFHEKRKIRLQKASVSVGLRFQTDRNPDKSQFLQIGGYANYLTNSSYATWDEIDGMKLKTRLRKLNYINRLNYGAEVRIGSHQFGFFAKYRISDLIIPEHSEGELPRVIIGLQFDLPTSGDF